MYILLDRPSYNEYDQSEHTNLSCKGTDHQIVLMSYSSPLGPYNLYPPSNTPAGILAVIKKFQLLVPTFFTHDAAGTVYNCTVMLPESVVSYVLLIIIDNTV